MKFLKKIDVEKLKEIFFNHGEKIALGVCATLALFLGLMGLLQASGAGRDQSGTPWSKALDNATKKIQEGIQHAPMPKLEPKMIAQLDPSGIDWKPYVSPHTPLPYSQIAELSLDKRENPSVLPIRSAPGTIQLDYHRALVQFFEYDRLQPIVMQLKMDVGAVAGNPYSAPWMKKAEARRMVVGSAVFPLKDQVKRFRDALRYKTTAEMLDKKEDLPVFAGITVKRYEVKPGDNSKLPEGEVLVQYFSKDKIEISEALKSLLKDAIYDDKFAESVEPYLFVGPVMPMPRIANGQVAKLNVKGINVATEDGAASPDMKKDTAPAMPKKDMPKKVKTFFDKDTAAPKQEAKAVEVALDKLQEDPVKIDRLSKDYPTILKRLYPDLKANNSPFNIYHILGEYMPEIDPNQKNQNLPKPKYFSAWEVVEKTPAAPQPVGKGGVAPANVAAAPVTDWTRDALVRFIDPDVKPGKSYKYSIQVWLRNPNYQYKDKDQVQFAGLMLKEDLNPSDVVYTPVITIPTEYGIYAVDQQLLEDWVATGKSEIKWAKDHTTFQVHQWIKSSFEKASGADLVIGDWAIAERIDVRKGDPIGQNVLVRVPVWKKEKDGFELYGQRDSRKGIPGFRANLTPPAPDGDNASGLSMPILVDFTGGKRINAGNGKIDEEAAVDALVLMPDGKLKIMNSRIDAQSPERNERLQSTRQRNDLIHVPAGKGP